MHKIFSFVIFLTLMMPLSYGHEFTTDENYFYRNGEKFIVKGIVYVPVYPGDLPWELVNQKNIPESLKKNFRRDIQAIKSAGANTIRLWDAPREVYRAIKETGGLAIIQTIWFDSRQPDLQDPTFRENCKRAIRDTLNRIYSVYSKDDPPPMLGFIVGSELSRPSIEDTDVLHPEAESCGETHITTLEGATASQCFLAEMADYLKAYQIKNFGHADLVSYANEVRTYDVIDTPFLDFRSYNVYTYAILDYLSPKSGSTTGTAYQGWVEALKAKHPKKPLLVTETGLSVSPNAAHNGPPEYGYGGNTEEEQAEAIAQNWKDLMTANAPIAGMVVHEYLDAWWKFGKKDSLEQDPDDVEEWFGLAAIEKEGEDFKTRLRPSYQRLQQIWQ